MGKDVVPQRFAQQLHGCAFAGERAVDEVERAPQLEEKGEVAHSALFGKTAANQFRDHVVGERDRRAECRPASPGARSARRAAERSGDSKRKEGRLEQPAVLSAQSPQSRRALAQPRLKARADDARERVAVVRQIAGPCARARAARSGGHRSPTRRHRTVNWRELFGHRRHTGSVVWYDRNGNPGISNFWLDLPRFTSIFRPIREPNFNRSAGNRCGAHPSRLRTRVDSFTSQNQSENLGLIANPYDLGWNYQSFGVWNQFGTGDGTVGATSFGTATPGSSVPTNGAATFSVKLAGLYISPAGQGSIATADLNVNVDFSTRSLSFYSAGTSVTRAFRPQLLRRIST